MRYERLNAVLELLAENDHMSVNELADRLAVSTATVRRDLDHLSAQPGSRARGAEPCPPGSPTFRSSTSQRGGE